MRATQWTKKPVSPGFLLVIFGATWFIAEAIAGLGGVFVGSSSEIGVDPNLGFIAFKAFPAVIVGGLESPLGAVIAGLALGVLEVLTSAYLNGPWVLLAITFTKSCLVW